MSRAHPRAPGSKSHGARPAAPELLFCAVCQVSIAAAEIARGAARRTPRGRVFCPICTKATPEQRAARRAALELEFADDAPIASTTQSAPRATPVAAVPRRRGGPPLEDRVAELERAAFRMQARLDSIDAKLDAITRRRGG